MSEHIEQGSGKIVFWMIFIVLLIGAGILVMPFVPALLWATVLSVMLYPWYQHVRKRYANKKHGDTLASLWVTLFTAFLVIVPMIGLATIAGIEVYNFASSLVADTGDGRITIENLGVEADKYVGPWLEKFGVRDFKIAGYVTENKAEIVRNVYGPITVGIKRVVMMVITLILAFLTTFFMLRDGHKLLDPVSEIIPLPRERTAEVIGRMAGTIRSVFWSVIAVGILQGLLCLLIYLACGLPSPMAWFALTTVVAMIPLVGAPGGYVPAGLVMIFSGHPVQGILILALGFGIVSTVDNYLRSKFISQGSRMHLIAVFFSLLGGIIAMGPIGLMGGPLLLTVLLAMIDVLRERRRIADAALT